MDRELLIRIRALIEGTKDVDRLSKEMRDLGKQRIPDTTSRFRRGIRATGRALRRVTGGAMRRFRSSIDRTRASLVSMRGLLVGLGAAAFFGKQARDSLQFEHSLSQIVGLVGLARSEVEKMKPEVLELAKATGRSSNELAEALFFITSAGARGQVALDILEASAKAAAAGMGETKAVADAATSAINAYGAENLSAARAVDVLTATVREGKTEAESLAPQFGNLLPLAEELGIEFDQVGAGLAFLTRTTGDASRAGTQLRGVLNKLVKPTMEGRKEFARLAQQGFNIRKVIREEGLLSALIQLRERLGVNSEAFAKIFEDAEAFVGVLQLTGEKADDARGIFDRLAESTGTLDTAYGAVADDGLTRLNRAQEKLNSSMKDFNEDVLPELIGGLEFAVRKSSELADEIRTMTEGIAGDLGLINRTELGDLDTAITQIERKLKGGLLSRTGLLTLGGEFQFHLSDEELEAELQRLKDRRNELLEEMGFSPIDEGEDEGLDEGGIEGGVGGGDTGGDAGGMGGGAANDRVKRIQKVIAALREEADTYGMGAEQQIAYRLEKLGATKAQIEQAKALTRDIELKEADAEAVEKQMEAEQERLEALRERRKENQALVAELEEELELLKLGDRERAQEVAVRRLSAEATDQQREAVRKLAGELYDAREAAKESTDDMSEFTKQAARNMQDAFAEFLFDPFDEGLEGMLKSFADTLQRMAAQAVAAQVFDAIGNWGKNNSGGDGGGDGFVAAIASFAGSYFGGGKAAGGPVSSGMAYIVGEKGRELFVPETDGQIVPNDMTEGMIGEQSVYVSVYTRDPDTRVESRATRARSRQRELQRDGRYL